MTPIWVATDPGETTAVIARDGDKAIAHELIHRALDEWPGHGIGPVFLAHVTTRIHDFRARVAEAYPGRVIRLAIEGVNVPGGFKDGKRAFVHPRDLITVSLITGALIGEFPQAIIVPPGGNGSGLLASYPPEFVTPGELARGLDRQALQNTKERHLRSAWDVSLVAERISRRLVVGKVSRA